MQTHMNYSKFEPGEEPVTRTFRLAKADWLKLLTIREQLLIAQGIKLSLNATLIYILNQHGRGELKTEA